MSKIILKKEINVLKDLRKLLEISNMLYYKK